MLRVLDLVVLALAFPIFVAADFPLWGYAAGAALWLAQRAVQVLLDRRAAASDDPRTVVGLAAGSMIGRGWLVALSIFGIGLVDEDYGLAAAVLFIAIFTAYFSARMIARPFEEGAR